MFKSKANRSSRMWYVGVLKFGKLGTFLVVDKHSMVRYLKDTAVGFSTLIGLFYNLKRKANGSARMWYVGFEICKMGNVFGCQQRIDGSISKMIALLD